MEILDISTVTYTTNVISVLIKYNSGKTGRIDVGNGEVRNSTLPEEIKNKIISLIARDSYKWLKKKYNELSELDKKIIDKEYFIGDYARDKEHLKAIHKELKKLYTVV